MAVDGIGKGGPRPPSASGESSGVQRPEHATVAEPFAPKDASKVEAVAATPLEQLQRGEISVDEYLDLRVDNAVRHLSKTIGATELDFVRQTLREQLATDPVLIELVQRATGSTGVVREP